MGGLEASERSRLQEQFSDNQIDILCATNAFGMRSTNPDVRGVIHFDLPDSLKITCKKSGELDVMVKKSWALLLYKKGMNLFIGFLRRDKANRATLKSLIEGEEQAGFVRKCHRVTTKMGSRLFSQVILLKS